MPGTPGTPGTAGAAGTADVREAGEPSLLAALLPHLINFVVPLVLYYSLRGAGVTTWIALAISGAVPAGRLVHTLATGRGADPFDVFVTGFLLLGSAVSAAGGGPRALLLQDAGMSGLAGLWMLGTLSARSPFVLVVSQQWYGPAARDRRWAAYTGSPRYRRGLRTLTALWAAGMLLDCLTGVAFVLTLPADVVPSASRITSGLFIAAVATGSLLLARRFRRRHALSLFGRFPVTGEEGAAGNPSGTDAPAPATGAPGQPSTASGPSGPPTHPREPS